MMTHGGKSIPEPILNQGEEDAPKELHWMTIGPWHYALGDFGTVHGFDGPPWIVEIPGEPSKMYRTLASARRALEDAADAEAHEVVPLVYDDEHAGSTR